MKLGDYDHVFFKLDVYNKQNIVKFLVVNDKFLLNVHAYTDSNIFCWSSRVRYNQVQQSFIYSYPILRPITGKTCTSKVVSGSNLSKFEMHK